METELKLTFKTREDLMSIPHKKWFKKFLLPDAPTRQELISSYFDTPDMAFRRAGAVVRVREVSGDDFIHTVKVSTGANEGLHQRYEWNHKTSEERFNIETFLEQAKVDDDPYSILQDVLIPALRSELNCILQTKFTRTSYLSGFGDSISEVSFDVGEVIVGDRHEDICEMEIELINGDVRDLLALGEIVRAKSPCEPESLSKFGRGIRLLISDEMI
ncbi:MAG: CYTH domain-containing protein [Oscillospiraceae bacterium]|nr:CYTH domain-containing protein [Oscillospiraceae bacterium]